MKKIRADKPMPNLDAEWLTTEGFKRKEPKPKTNFVAVSRLQQQKMDSYFVSSSKTAGKLTEVGDCGLYSESAQQQPLRDFSKYLTSPPTKPRYVAATYTPSSSKEINKTGATKKTPASKTSNSSASCTPSSSTRTYKTLGKGKLSLNFKQGIPITTYTPSTSADTKKPEEQTTDTDIYALKTEPGSTRTYKTLGKGRIKSGIPTTVAATKGKPKGELNVGIMSDTGMVSTTEDKNEVKTTEKKKSKSWSKFSMDDDDVSVELELDAFDINNISDDEILEGLNFTIPDEDTSLLNCALFASFGSQDSNSDNLDLDLFSDI